MSTTGTVAFDPKELELKVKAMYRSVAENPRGEFHFEMGRALAERLGYAPSDLDRIPAEAIESFAGVGYYFHLADLKAGETVLDSAVAREWIPSSPRSRSGRAARSSAST